MRVRYGWLVVGLVVLAVAVGAYRVVDKRQTERAKAAAQTGVAPAGLIAGSSAAASCPAISTTGSVHCRSVLVLQPGIQQVAFCHPVAQLAGGA